MTTPRKMICPSCGVALSTAGIPVSKPFRCPQCKKRVEYPTAVEQANEPEPSSSVLWYVLALAVVVALGAGGWYFTRGWWNKAETVQT